MADPLAGGSEFDGLASTEEVAICGQLTAHPSANHARGQRNQRVGRHRRTLVTRSCAAPLRAVEPSRPHRFQGAPCPALH